MKIQSKTLQTVRIRSASEIAPFIDKWKELANCAPMQSPEWFLSWWASYATPETELCIVLILSEGELVGLAPLYIQGAEGGGQVQILGASNACTHHSSWITAKGWENLVGLEVANFLLSIRSSWKRLFFESVDENAKAVHVTVDFLADNGFLFHKRQINSCWKITLPDTWEAYVQMLSRSLRKRCRKLQREFLDSGKVQIRQAETEAELQKGLEILYNLHAARWGSAKKPLGVFEDQRFRSFHERISKILLSRNQLRLAWLESEGEPIAVEYQFVDSGSVYAYQAGINLSQDKFSPGKLTMMAAIRFAISSGCKNFDLLRGDEPYKKHWRATSSDCFDLRVWPRSLYGRLEWMLWSGYSVVSRKLKPYIPTRLVEMGFKTVQIMKLKKRP